jgi:hypothetical protein
MSETITFSLIAFFCTLFIFLKSGKLTFPFLYCIQEGRNFSLGTIITSNPLQIDKASIKNIIPSEFRFNPPLRFMADPFIVKEEGYYYIFFEQLDDRMFSKGASIASIRSIDFKNWTHLGVVLNEPFHLSYPSVHKYAGKWYMLPETVAAHEVRLYESANFPFKWEYKVTLLAEDLVDPTLFMKDDIFYLLGQKPTDRSLRLYCSSNLVTGWSEHPKSPIRSGVNETQPAGQAALVNGKLIYFVQDHTHGYGTSVIAYSIEILTLLDYEDLRLTVNPVLDKNGNTWAEMGMHHISWIENKTGEFYCTVDGVEAPHPKKWKFSLSNLPKFTS